VNLIVRLLVARAAGNPPGTHPCPPQAHSPRPVFRWRNERHTEGDYRHPQQRPQGGNAHERGPSFPYDDEEQAPPDDVEARLSFRLYAGLDVHPEKT
jgi:hypothetical protein